MHQTRKGNQWYFGMKAHIGVVSKNRMIHAVAATAANVHDSQMLPDLLHGEETRDHTKSWVRARVEHPFHVYKRVSGFVKVIIKTIDISIND